MTTKIHLSKDKMQRNAIPEYLKNNNLTLANWDECVADKEFIKENDKELKGWYVWVDSKNLKKTNTIDLHVSDVAVEHSKDLLPVGLDYDLGWLRVIAVDNDPYYAARVAVKSLKKAFAKAEIDDVLNDLVSRVNKLEAWRKKVSE